MNILKWSPLLAKDIYSVRYFFFLFFNTAEHFQRDTKMFKDRILQTSAVTMTITDILIKVNKNPPTTDILWVKLEQGKANWRKICSIRSKPNKNLIQRLPNLDLNL